MGWRFAPTTVEGAAYGSLELQHDPATDAPDYYTQLAVAADKKGGAATLRSLTFDFDLASGAGSTWSLEPTPQPAPGTNHDLTLKPSAATTLLKLKSADSGLRFEDASGDTPQFWQIQARNTATTGAGFDNLLISTANGNEAMITGSGDTVAPGKYGGAVTAMTVSY